MSSQPITIDCDYLKPQFACAYLLREGDRTVFIETNTAHSVPLLLAELKNQGLNPEQVDYVIVTHVHLDHAGGASALMAACPNAKLLAHPRAARHLIQPQKLVESAKHVYGDEVFDKLYGRIDPIPAERVREMADEERLSWGSREFRFLHTRGHANHHFCVVDSSLNGVFTGDSFGLAYPDLQKQGLFVFPSTSPTDFDAEQALKTVDRIEALGVKHAYLTHFGAIDDIPEAARQLRDHLKFSADLLQNAIQSKLSDLELPEFCRKAIHQRFQKLGRLNDAASRELLEMDLNLNGDGIAHVATRKRGLAVS